MLYNGRQLDLPFLPTEKYKFIAEMQAELLIDDEYIRQNCF